MNFSVLLHGFCYACKLSIVQRLQSVYNAYMWNNVVIIGGAGAVGSACVRCVLAKHPKATVHAVVRASSTLETVKDPRLKVHRLDAYTDEKQLAGCIQAAAEVPLDAVLVATGMLHDKDFAPEKSLRELSCEHFQRAFTVNTVIPALVAKHTVGHFSRGQRVVFAALSARVGSISDNRLGGWYAYRASKAALNMVIKNIALEVARSHKEAVVVGLHPGTVDSALSKPFQTHLQKRLFTPDEAAKHLVELMQTLSSKQTGRCFAWDGSEIAP